MALQKSDMTQWLNHNDLFILFPYLPQSLFYKITQHPDLVKMVILRHYSAIFWSIGIKLSSLPQHLASTSLVSRASLDFVTIVACNLLTPNPLPTLPFGNHKFVFYICAAAAAKSLQSCLTLRPHGQQPTRLLCPWDSPGKNTGVGCHFFSHILYPVICESVLDCK